MSFTYAYYLTDAVFFFISKMCTYSTLSFYTMDMSAFLKFISIYSWNMCMLGLFVAYRTYIWKRIDRMLSDNFCIFLLSPRTKNPSIHLNLNSICIFCTSKHFYNFKYFMAWICISCEKVFSFSHNNFPTPFLRLCVISRNTNHRLFSTICVSYKGYDKREQCEFVVWQQRYGFHPPTPN